MSSESTPSQVAAEHMVPIPAGAISLRDEGTKAVWKAEVKAFRLAQHP